MQQKLRKKTIPWFVRLAFFLVAVYFFLVGIELFGEAMKILGSQTAEGLTRNLSNPFAGLAVGILSTALVQSSSVTTCWIVAAVGAGTLDLSCAVPMVMGANIGTSVTSAMVSIGHINHKAGFKRAVAGATVHDIFNVMCVAIFLPLEMATGFLQKTAQFLVEPLMGTGYEFHSPIKDMVKFFPGFIKGIFHDWMGLEEGGWLAAILLVIALIIVIVALIQVTKNMRLLIADRMEEWINRVLKKSGLLGLAIGAAVTALVQSSSITTSLLIPMFGAGVLTVEAGFPIILGANIGTTVTAMLAATVSTPAGLTIALVHLLFNLSGVLLFFPIPWMRKIPLKLADRLADFCIRYRFGIFIFIFIVFFLIPFLGILIWK